MSALDGPLPRYAAQARRVFSTHVRPVVDLALAVALAIGALWELATLRAERMVGASAVAAVCCVAPVAWRRAWPVFAALSSWTALAAYQVSSHDPNGAFIALAIVLVCYSVGRTGSWPRLVGVAGWALVASTVIEIDAGFSLAADLAAWCFALAGLAAGCLVTHWVKTAQRLGDVNAELTAERESQRAQAVAGERLRVARDLHDVVAHGLSAMVILAGAARLILASDADAARECLRSIASSGREALTDLRRVVGVRRRDIDPASTSPGVADLDQLVEHARAAGLSVSLRVDDHLRLSPDVQLTVFRLAQEALTNVRKHAPDAKVDVVIDGDGHEIELRVTNGPASAPASRVAAAGTGLGLIGMRERVALHGGRLRTSLSKDGGFELAARLSLQQAVSPPSTPPAEVCDSNAAGGLRRSIGRWLRRWPPAWLDTAIGAIWLVPLEIQALSGDHLHVPRAAGVTLVGLMAAAALVRRRLPLQFLVIVGALNLILTALAASHSKPADAVGTYTLAVATYAVATYSPLRRAVLGLLIMLIGTVTTATLEHQAASYAFGGALMAGAIWTAGRLVRRQRLLSQQLRNATSELIAEQETSRALALDAERARIARDLHLLVASLATSMVIRAESAIDVATVDPPAAGEFIAAIEHDGRQAMAQMRQILGVLRHSDARAPRQPTAEYERRPESVTQNAPQPLLATGTP